MQHKEYQLMRDRVKEKVDSQNWTAVDQALQQITLGLYNFQPKPQYTLYYKRLIYLLNNDSQQKLNLTLSAYMLCLNTNNYYALMLRSSAFKNKIQSNQDTEKLLKDINEELYFTSCILNTNPKQYQIWNYKKNLMEWAIKLLPQIHKQILIQEEEEFLFFLMTNDDEKNYHAWDYMSYLARLHGDIQLKLKETEAKLFIDLDNDGVKCQSLWADCYSCWSYRFNLLIELPKHKICQYVQEEYKKVMNFINNNLRNECAWNYLGGLVNRVELGQQKKYQIMKKVVEIGRSDKGENNKLVWSFLLLNGDQIVQEESLKKLKTIDPIRQAYYDYLTQIKQS